MNDGKTVYYKWNKNGHSVFFDGVEVADKLTTAQARQLIDDLSYYGTPMYCAYNRRELCLQGEVRCINCPERKKREDEDHV